jgi:hypothetical protein
MRGANRTFGAKSEIAGVSRGAGSYTIFDQGRAASAPDRTRPRRRVLG